ncbi:hypothetical protein BSKO_10977 [Bryopsis sp. KO-2023]|nr:hypothetical protein BSKO_10977 [Bryopsis sp. KO-2023]
MDGTVSISETTLCPCCAAFNQETNTTEITSSMLRILNRFCRRIEPQVPVSFVSKRRPLATVAADAQVPQHQEDYPGGKGVSNTSLLEFFGGRTEPRPVPVPIPCFRSLDAAGEPLGDCKEEDVAVFSDDLALRVYETMVKLQTVDVLFYEAQRQGRLSFYLTSFGEEATTVGSAAAFELDDSVFLQYREQGVLLWRGISFRQMADQCYGNALEPAKGRQMPIHYGSLDLNVHTIASTLGTQLPHAVGAAFAHKVQKSDAVSVVYFGDGASSEGDFHAAMNFAATISVPIVFICRNNGFAISTPVEEQYRGDGVAGRGPGYGIATTRVDGGDARAVYCAARAARKMAIEKSSPVLIEALTYRSGHHSTSDDSSRYRPEKEMEYWQSREPVVRLRQLLVHKQIWDEEKEKSLRKKLRNQVISALDEAQKVPKAPASDVLTDVYESLPWHLEEQREELMEFLRVHPNECPSDIPNK